MEILYGVWDVISSIFANSGYAYLFTGEGYKNLIMILVSFLFLWLGIKKGFEPLLMIPIAFGMLLANLPNANLAVQYHDLAGFFDLLKGRGEYVGCTPGLMDFLYFGVKAGIYPPLIFLGIGSMTDFSSLIASPSSFLMGAAAQLGIFVAYVLAIVLGFDPQQAGSIAIIGGADGPTAIFVTSKLAPAMLGTIADAASLVGMLMLGNLLKESGRTERIAKAAQNELMNIITILLGISVGATTNAQSFLNWNTIKVVILGLIAFSFGTAGGVLFGKIMYICTKGKVNPLIGSAGVSAVPMAARVSQKEGQRENPTNFLLMHAMGPNVSGVIGSAVAAGILLTLLG